MINLKQFSHKVTLLLLLLSTMGFAQKKNVESFNVAKDVEVSVNTAYTNVIFETWNKDKVEVEAFIKGDKLSEKEKQEMMKNWDLEITGNSKKVSINSNAGNGEMFSMGDMPQMDFIGPLMENMVMPMISNIQVPPLPEDLLENLGNIQFDYEAYQKDEEGYMKKFEAQMDKNFGKDFEKKMEDWGNKFSEQWKEKKGDSLSKSYEKKMEKWGEEYGKKMEAWGEDYGKKMEVWASEIAKNYENSDENYTKKVITSPNGKTIIIQGDKKMNFNGGKANKTIIIRLPKDTKIDINVKHGELKMADAKNVQATLNYSSFIANSIDGGKTLINASYAPVAVNNWKQGTLQVKFVDNCRIENAENINLQANSSDVIIGNVGKQAFLSGSFGDLNIKKISDTFETIDIRLENTDAILQLPKAAFSFYFNGKKTPLKYPKFLQLKETKNSDRLVVKGFNQNNTTNKTITINSTYSNVSLQ